LRVRPALDTSFGGAVVLDRDGNVAGIAGLDVPGADDGDASYLLPASTAQLVSSALLRNGSVTHNAFGIVAEDLSQALADRLGAGRERGAIVAIVEQRSPAARAGLKAGDVVLAAGGSPVSGASELARALDTDAPTLELDILRGSDRLTIGLRNPGAGR
jgi:serine protease Do